MKIGIFTQPLKSNYGGILQNYAMQVVLKRMGHEPWTVDYLRFTWWDWFVVAVKVTIKKCLGRKANYPKSPTKVQRQENPLRRFALKYIQLTQPRVKYPNKSILQTYGFDALLVGSDQTWRPMYNGKIYDMYLQLAERMNVKRVAYAASFGTDQWEYTPEQESECARLAKLFDAISVREASGVGLCRELHTGSRFSAENIAFMYSLLESCKLNNVNFGEYIEDTLTRLMKGEKADASFQPNKYVPRPKEESKTAA